MSRVISQDLRERIAIAEARMRYSAFSEKDHPRGQPDNAGQFAPKDSSVAKTKDELTAEFNKRLDDVERVTGKDSWSVIEMIPFDASREDQMAFMDKLIQDHGDKPKEWEPENQFSMDKFETGDWETPEKAASRKEWWESHNQIRNKFRDDLAESDLDNKTRAKHLMTAQEVLKYMPTPALKALHQNVEKAKFYKNLKDLTEYFSRNSANKPSGTIGGCWEGRYDSSKGVLHLDGGFSNPTSIETRGIYSHEFGHACDWVEREPTEEDTEHGTFHSQGSGAISNTGEWHSAFADELAKGQLSQYGATHRSEGFAEFARLVWGTGQRPRDIAAEYPKCFAVFKKHGLVK